MMWSILLLLVVSLTTSSSQEIRADPATIIYPGQVNIGLISNVHGPTTNGSDGCGTLRPEAVQRAMAAVWAAHQANFEKDDPQELNIGIYIFDTCGREDVAERQVYRLLGHVGHVQTTDCSEKRIPPLFAVITEGDTQSLGVPLKLLQAFSVPVISTSGPLLPKTLSTAPSAEGLARAAVSVLRHLHLLEVAVMAEDNPPMGLFEAFSRQVQVSGMQAIQLDNGTDQSEDDFMATLKLISEYGKSRLKAVVFLIGSEQALQLLRSVDDMNLPQIPWVIVTPSDISNEIITTFQRQQIQRLQKILLLSPESLEVPEFDNYFRQLLEEDTIKYHSLLMEFLQTVEGSAANGSVTPADSSPITTLSIFGNNTVSARLRPDVYPADVSSMVKAVWTLSAALKTVQRRSCRRGTDCLLYLRRSLSSYVARAAAGIDHIVESGAENLKGTRLKFNEEGIMTSNKYGLKGFTIRGDIKDVGFFSDDEGLNVDRYILDTFTEAITFTEPIAPLTLTPKPEFKFKLKPDKVLPSPELTPSKSTAEEPSTKFPLKSQDLVKWKILEDTVVTEVPTETTTDRETTTPKENIHNDIDVVVALHDEVDLQSLSSNASSLRHSSAAASMIGPSYTSEHRAPPASSSSNLRSISLTSHQEPRVNDAYRDDVRLRPETNSNHPSTPREDVKVTRPNRHVSAWLGRPWALSVLGVCGFLILATLYILVFLMVKACEGTLKKTNCCLAGTQLVALLCLYIAAALYTWKPSSLLCGLQRLIPNISLAFCYGCLLLKGMYLRAQNSLGLGGSVNRFNQMLTLLFIVGVQVALETQWWLVKPPRISEESLDCLIGKTEILQSQVYVAFLLLLSTALAVSTRRIPYNQQESRSLIVTTLSCLVIFLSWEIACWLLPDATSRNIAAPSALMATALTILLGIFGPQLFAIHKYGGFPHKPLSYADSLSTVFTMFKDLDNTSSSGTTSRGKKNAKTLETPFANEIGEGTRNPLYSDYQSAYP